MNRNEVNFLTVISPNGNWAGVFENDGETAYFYLYEHGKGIRDSALLFYSQKVTIVDDQISIYWTQDGSKCGIVLLRQYRVVFDLRHGQKTSKFMESLDSVGIQDVELLSGFPTL